eukprot:Phypoly_transcript_12632.p1 GENE.Phypoly_transcript_12632~~Phypoly_transcript_12632.p1  ORF type:complete len:278 (+),score=39.72 Phypoly_transcript_12632:89-922(+)
MLVTNWKKTNYTFALKESSGKFVLEAVDRNTKQPWCTQDITEKAASTVLEGLFDDPLDTLASMVKDGLNENSSDATYSLSVKENVVEFELAGTIQTKQEITIEFELTVAFYKNKTRKFVLTLHHKEVTDLFRLEQIIDDLRYEIATLKAFNEECKVICAHSRGPFENPKINFEAARIDDLPPGKWLVETSFQLTYANWGQSTGWIYYMIILGDVCVPDCPGGRYVADGQNNSNAYPVVIHDRYVVESKGREPLFFRGSPYQTQPTFKNVIITATRIA